MTTTVIVLGSTGSIGVNTLDVISRHPAKYQVYGLSAHRNVEKMFAQCRRFRPERAVMVDADAANELRTRLAQARIRTEVGSGQADVCTLAGESGDIVVCGIVGAAGLMSAIAAIKAGKKVLIANKEPLVMMGRHIVDLAQKHNACLLPLDSEHNAIFQCLPQHSLVNRNGYSPVNGDQGVGRILLTGSGGPLRLLPLDMLSTVTPEQACAHPNWKMGPKISVDSATMMNKGLELIEACVLFCIPENRVQIVIHPQSIVHSMVEYIDGSIIAQMGSPDMRIPIANALAWPDRISSGAKSLDFMDVARFDFEPPDHDRFPSLRLARSAAITGGTMPAIMSAANEVAVDGFLSKQISFDKIARIVESTMDKVPVSMNSDLDHVFEADSQARRVSRKLIAD